MAGIGFGYQRLTEGTLSRGSWETLLPQANMLDPRREVVARTTDATTASTQLQRDYGAAVEIGVIATVRSNLQATAQWRIRAGSDATFATSSYDSGWIDCWPEQWPVGVLPSGHPNAATRTFTNADIARRRWDVLLVLPTPVTARYWRIEYDDTTNTDGYVEIGVLVMAPLYIPGNDDNVGVGAELGRTTTTNVGTALSGTRYVDARPIARTITLTIPALALDEAVSVLHDMLLDIGLDGLVYVVFDTADIELLQRRAFLATQTELSAVQLVQYGQQTVPVKLIEAI